MRNALQAMLRIMLLLICASLRVACTCRLIDGLQGMSSHSNTRVRVASFKVLHTAQGRFIWIVKARVPRLLSVINLKDGIHSQNAFGVPICEQLSNNEQGNIRLFEVVFGSLSLLSSRFKFIMNDPDCLYGFIKKSLVFEEVVLNRMVDAKNCKALELQLESLWNLFRSHFSFDSSGANFDAAHLDCVQFLLRNLRNGGNSGGSGDASGGADGSSEHAYHWKKKLMLCWFLTQLLGEREVASVELALQIWSVGVGLIEGEMDGMREFSCAA